MKHPQHHFVEGKCKELLVLDIALNCVRVYVLGQYIHQFSINA